MARHGLGGPRAAGAPGPAMTNGHSVECSAVLVLCDRSRSGAEDSWCKSARAVYILLRSRKRQLTFRIVVWTRHCVSSSLPQPSAQIRHLFCRDRLRLRDSESKLTLSLWKPHMPASYCQTFCNLRYIIIIEGLVSKSALRLGKITRCRCSLTLAAVTVCHMMQRTDHTCSRLWVNVAS